MGLNTRNRIQSLLVEQRELAPYASKSLLSLGRKYREPGGECDLRTAFQRDVGRVMHSAAFRKLQYKTQVFSCGTDSLVRTRLTHTLAVSHIARTIARSLWVNEDLTEAIALAHDVGHPPFGHVGEDVLNARMSEYGGFEHNAHSVRVVDHLEYRTNAYKGLNLSYEVREGLARHCTEHDNPAAYIEFMLYAQPSIEAQIVDLADMIAYRSHDLEDGLSLGVICPDDLNANGPPLWRRCLPDGWRQLCVQDIAVSAPRRLISEYVTNVVHTTIRTLDGSGLETADDVRSFSRRTVGLSAEVQAEDMLIGNYLTEKLYNHPELLAERRIAEDRLQGIFDHLLEHTEMPSETGSNDGERSLYRAVCDSVASMTELDVVRMSGSQLRAEH